MGNKAFDGVKVADFSWMITGPLIAKYLGEHGAQVIHIESSVYVDGMRTGGPMKDGIPGINRSSYFANYNNNKYVKQTTIAIYYFFFPSSAIRCLYQI